MTRMTMSLKYAGLAVVLSLLACAGDLPPATPGGSGGSYAGYGGYGATGGVGGSAAVGGAGGGGGADAGTNDASVIDSGPPSTTTVITEPNDPAAYLYDQNQIRTYNIIVAPNDLATIDQNPMAEVYVPASLEFEGTTYGSLSVRYKGGFGAFLPPCSGTQYSGGGPKTGKCSIKLAFDQVDPNGRFFGLKKLNFHSMNRDPSMLRDRLGYSLFREMGLVAPRSVHVRVLINGRLEGLFAIVEQVDGRFTRSRFSEGGEGNLYKAIWPIHSADSAYIAALESNQNQMPSVQGMLSFKTAVETSATATERLIDRDYTMKYVAVDRVIINDDGIFHWWCTMEGAGNNPGGIGNHNYYWYQELLRERFWLIPWDFDHAFNNSSVVHIAPEWTVSAPCTCTVTGNSFVAQRPPSCDRLTQHFSSWISDYSRHADAFIAGPFASTAVNAKLDTWTNQIRASVIEAAGINGAPTEAVWNTNVTALRSFIDAARANRGYQY